MNLHTTDTIFIVKPVNVSTGDAEAGIWDVVIGWTDPVVGGLESEVCWVVDAVMGEVTESSETASVGTENEEKVSTERFNTNAISHL